MPVIFTNGNFDILHSGHYQLLMYCRYLAEGDPVYVAIDSDVRVRKQKGEHKPYYNQEERRTLLCSLTSDGKIDKKGYGKFIIDWVDIFDTSKQLHDIIKHHNPDYIVKGSDWKNKDVIGSDIAKIHYAPTYYKQYFSSSQIEKRILEKHGLK